MARRVCRVRDGTDRVLMPDCRDCPECGSRMRIRYENRRTVLMLSGFERLRLKFQRCENPACGRYHRAYRPEAEEQFTLPHHEFGLDVITLIGALRHRGHRSVPEIHAALSERGLMISEGSVTNLLDRYDKLVAATLGAPNRAAVAAQGRFILALDGLQPDIWHEVLWVIRDCLSGRVLLARSLLSATQADLAGLLREVTTVLRRGAGSGNPGTGGGGRTRRTGADHAAQARPPNHPLPHRRRGGGDATGPGADRLVLDRVERPNRLTVEAEHTQGFNGDREELRGRLRRQVKAATGVGAEGALLAPGTLTRAIHKAKRIDDHRQHVWS